MRIGDIIVLDSLLLVVDGGNSREAEGTGHRHGSDELRLLLHHELLAGVVGGLCLIIAQL